jgi:hypothetical protein
MAAVVLGVGTMLPPGVPAIQRLFIESSVGALTYLAMMFGLQRERVRVLKTLLSQLKK